MGISDWNAGIIRPIPVAPTGPYETDTASGIWTLDQVTYWQKQGLWPTAGNPLPVGLFAGSVSTGPTVSNVIAKITIATASNATDFGDLSGVRAYLSSASSKVRGLFAGGTANLSSAQNKIEYVTIATTGNTTNFGDLAQVSAFGAACSDATTAVFLLGSTSGSFSSYLATNVLNYVTIASTGNATDFGDIATTNRHSPSGCSSSTRGLFSGGGTSAPNSRSTVNVIDYITIASAGNTTNFGNLTYFAQGTASCSSSTRGVIAGGARTLAGTTTYWNTINYVTIATTGNATNFGDLTSGRDYLAGASSSLRAVFGGGDNASANVNVLDYVTIATTGNAIDFGDLLSAGSALAACSNTHGGL